MKPFLIARFGLLLGLLSLVGGSSAFADRPTPIGPAEVVRAVGLGSEVSVAHPAKEVEPGWLGPPTPTPARATPVPDAADGSPYPAPREAAGEGEGRYFIPLVSNSDPLLARAATTTPVPSPRAASTAVPTAITQATVPPAPTSAPVATSTKAPTAAPPPTQPVGPSQPGQMVLRTDLPALALQDWPRPAGDNGRGMHFLRDQYFTEDQLHLNVARLQQLGAKWVLVVYADENQLRRAAPVFAAAGITPVWRKMLRPWEGYYAWERDIRIIESAGLPPYMQIYNEPELPAEWEDFDGEVDDERFYRNLLQATQDVYNAGGYVGWQFVRTEALDQAITRVQQANGSAVFGRMFFIPHPYGLNHPPNYTEDLNGALGFLFFADVFQRRIGFVPPMIAGEGGWKINADNDARFPRIDDARHRDFHVEVFNWFRTGTLSNGQPLPDYFFAYCPWLIADAGDDNAWWDSFAGPRQATIDAVSQLPLFTRRFSWGE